MMTRHRPDDGAAAFELAILIIVLFAVLALTIPLGQAFIEKMHVGRAAGTAARYAAAYPVMTGTRPTSTQVQQAADDAYVGDGGTGTPNVSVTLPTNPLPGDYVSVNVQKIVDLGPLGTFLHTINVIPSSTITVSATASDREE